MSPSQFIPARSSRHRVACIALYRALVREARAIPLPDDVLRKGTQNPIPRLVKKGFWRNRTETSYRIVFSALGTGYNFLNLFKAAQTPGSKEHSQIVDHLREKKLRDARSEAGKPPPRPPRPQKPKWPPLLQKTSKDDEPPAYISPRFPVPREHLTGARRVPHVAITAEGIAFLRQKKLQDQSVANYIQHKTKIKRRTMDLLLSSVREEIPWAGEEDQWERIVMKELLAARRQELRGMKVSGESVEGRHGPDARGKELPDKFGQEGSYGQMVTENRRFASKRLDDLVANQAARAKAFVEIRKVEKEMLEKDNHTYRLKGHRWMVDNPEKKMERHRRFRRDFRAAKIERKAKRREKNKWRRVRGLEPAPVGI